MARPIIGITMGDAAGVGPEIIMKAMAVPEVHEISRPLVIGDARRLRKAGEIVGSKLSVRPVQKPEEAAFRRGEVDVIDLPVIPEDLPFGKLSAVAGDAAFKFIQRAVELAMAGRIDGICTAPLNKEALHAGGHKYPGHTELLAKLAGIEEVSMMLSTPKMRGDFDLVVAMYHDQGHGPVKVLGLEAGVNITAGLPFVGTSVDHGTAFDIARTGKADERSLVQAMRDAVALARKTRA